MGLRGTLLACLVAALSLAFVTGTAAASRAIGIPGGAITATSSGKIRFATAAIGLECDIQMRGTLEARIPKEIVPPFGRITDGSATNCSLGATATLLFPDSPAWSMYYDSFLGTLPDITGVLFILENVQALVRIPLLGSCLYFGDFSALMRSDGRTVTLLPSGLLALETLSGMCPSPVTVTGAFDFSPAQAPMRLLDR